MKDCVVRTQPLPKGHVPLVTVLTANLLLILIVRKNIVRSDEITSGEESVGVQVPARPETPFHNSFHVLRIPIRPLVQGELWFHCWFLLTFNEQRYICIPI